MGCTQSIQNKTSHLRIQYGGKNKVYPQRNQQLKNQSNSAILQTQLSSTISQQDQIKIDKYLSEASRHKKDGKYAEQIASLLKVADAYHRQGQQNIKEKLALLNNIGIAYGKLENYHQATNTFIEALELHSIFQDDENQDLYTILKSNLTIYAKKTLRKKIKDAVAQLKRNGTKQPRSERQGRYVFQTEEASNIFVEVLLLSRQLNGDNHQITAKAYHLLGNDYLTKSQYSQALRAYQEALNIKVKIHGAFSKQLAMLLINIAHCKFKLACYSDGLTLYQEVLTTLYSQNEMLNHLNPKLLATLQMDLREMTNEDSSNPEAIKASMILIEKYGLSEHKQWKQIYEHLSLWQQNKIYPY